MNENSIIIDPKTEMLNKAGLNWNVKSEPLQTVSGILIPDRIALVREDTNKVLGIHTEQYVPYQNDELLELLFRISGQSGLQVHTGGSFHGGQRVWFQLKSEDLKLGDDTIKGYISGFNSFDGRTSLAFGTSNVTVSCMNSFFRGFKQVDTKLRHSSTMKPRIDEILFKIDLLLHEEQKSFNEIQRMSETRLTPEVKEMVIRKLFELSNEEKLDGSDGSTNRQNKLIRFGYDMGIELGQKKDNLWGMFSSVTRYTSHSMKKDGNNENKMFGRVGNIEREIYRELVEMV